MSSVRLWILILALTSFLAGTAGGVLGARRLTPPAPERGPFADYAELLVEAHDLPRDRARNLRVILALYHDDLEELKSRQVESLEPEIVRAGLTCRRRISEFVLTEAQRTRFDGAEALPLPE